MDVLEAIGLTMSDLFPKPLGNHFRPIRSRIPAADALATLDHESLVVTVIGADFLKQKQIDEPTWARLAQATNRINKTRAICAPPLVKR
jgi:hypothetical protein